VLPEGPAPSCGLAGLGSLVVPCNVTAVAVFWWTMLAAAGLSPGLMIRA